MKQAAEGNADAVKYYFAENVKTTTAKSYIGYDESEYLKKMGNAQTAALETIERSLHI